MSKVSSKLNFSQVGRVCVTVANTDRAISLYVDTLGFEKVVDVPMGEAMGWVEVARRREPERNLPRHRRRRRRPCRAQRRRR
jgi:catechol 2,3-dioxygenase-like lactoylglutathione lyase family enzyme